MSKFAAKANEYFHETKVFKIFDPTNQYVLKDENGVEFTVELYAPQSRYMQSYDDSMESNRLARAARTNNADQTNWPLMKKSGALRIAHAIKSWHPVSPKGEAFEVSADEVEIATTLIDPEVIWWLTDQLTANFKKDKFLIQKGGDDPLDDGGSQTSSAGASKKSKADQA